MKPSGDGCKSSGLTHLILAPGNDEENIRTDFLQQSQSDVSLWHHETMDGQRNADHTRR